jgi:hypothetical protein
MKQLPCLATCLAGKLARAEDASHITIYQRNPHFPCMLTTFRNYLFIFILRKQVYRH